MPNYTPNFKLKQPFPTENYNVEDQNGNMDIIDSMFEAHKAAATLDHPDNSVTDAKIGERTIDQTKTPVNTGVLSALLGGLANMIKKITGKSDWKTEPRTTLENAVKRDGDRMTGQLEINNTAPRFLLQDSTPDAKGVAFVNDLNKLFVQQTDGAGAKVSDRFSIDLTTGEGFLGSADKLIFHTGNHNNSGDPHAQYVRKTQAVTGDWNDVITTGFYDGNLLLNACPGGTHGWRYCQVTSHSQDGGARCVHQVMTAFDGTGTYERFSQDIGSQRKWTPWYLVSQHNNLRQYAGSKDEMKLLYKVVDHKRADGTIYAQSILSNPDANGNYQTLSLTYYNNAGTVALETKSWTFTYDSDGLITSKVPNF